MLTPGAIVVRDASLRDSLAQKDALMREIHHRVKNNLQVITSLLRLESTRTKAAGTRDVLKDMQGRIRSGVPAVVFATRSGSAI